MNLKVIHIVFVGSAVLLALFFGGWCLAQGAGFFALGVGSFVVAAALVVYGFWFWRKITTPEEEWNRRRKLFRTLPVVVGVWLFGSERAAWACSVCYGGWGVAGGGGGGGGGPMLDAARAGAWFLLGAVFVMQAAIVLFFLYLRRRARRYRTDPVPPWWSTVEEPVKS
jgi:O-antigen/teichoic acid export membrane protein